jgi:lipopolysaccharide export system protein LptA
VRWQRALRVVVALVGLGTAIALYVMTRNRPVNPHANASGTADPTATVQSGQGMTFRFKGNERESTIEYASGRQYDDGRAGWTGFHLVMSDGTDVRADLAETVGKASPDDLPKELMLKGHVSLKTPEGVLVTAEQIHWIDATGQATIPGPMTFARGRMSGTGTGAVYERDTGVFRVLADAHMTTASAPGETSGHVDATAQTMTFNRAGNALLFETHARIVHDTDVMSADRATLYLTPDHEQFRVIELRGSSRVQPAPGQTSSAPDMQAQDIDLAFYEGTQVLQRALLNGQATMVMIDGASRRAISGAMVMLTTAPDGKTVTHLEGTDRVVVNTPAQNGAPQRTITAPSLVANGDDQHGLTSAQFTGGVRFVETTPGRGGRGGASRTGTSQVLNLKLKGQLDAIDEAEFQQNVRFEDGDVVGDADVGIYLASKGQLTLKPFPQNARRVPRVTDGSVTVDASELIDVDLDTNDLHAKRDVKTVTVAQKNGDTKKTSPGLFNDQDPIYGQAVEFWYQSESKRGHYVGTADARARLQQQPKAQPQQKTSSTDASSVVAVDILVANDEDLTAKGSVESVFFLTDEKSETPATPTRYRVTAETLVYRDDARTATYTGAPVTMTSADGTTSSQGLVLKLAAEERSLERLEATGDVHSKLASGRDAIMDVLIYESSTGRYTLRGLNGVAVILREQADKPGSCSIVKGAVGYFTHADQVPHFPGPENPGGEERTERTGAACTGELKR